MLLHKLLERVDSHRLAICDPCPDDRGQNVPFPHSLLKLLLYLLAEIVPASEYSGRRRQGACIHGGYWLGGADDK